MSVAREQEQVWLTLQIPLQLRDRLDEKAAENERSRSAEVRVAIAKHLEDES